MNKFNHVLDHKGTKLRNICVKSQQINTLNSILHSQIPSPLRNHFKVANIRENCLVLEFTSAVWATKARFILQEIIDIAQTKFSNIDKVNWYIKPQ